MTSTIASSNPDFLDFTRAQNPPLREFAMSYADSVVGAALFDLNGLPKEYLAAEGNSDLSWVQAVFQALGLQSLLGASLRLEGLRCVVLHSLEAQAIVLRQETGYLALLLRDRNIYLEPQFMQWAKQLDARSLRQNGQFVVH